MKKVDIVIVHFGDPSITTKAIESLEKYITYRSIILINNDKNTKMPENVITNNRIVYIENNENVGFAAGVNKGIEIALKNGADYVLLFNNDARAVDDFLTPLFNTFDIDRKAGILSPVISFKKDGTTYYDFGGMIQKYMGRTYHNNLLSYTKNDPVNVDYVSGCCMLISCNVIKEVGLFDSSFFLYYEDVDFCLRAKQKGYFSYCVPKSCVQHLLSKSTGQNSDLSLYHLIKSARVFGKKYKDQFPFHQLYLLFQTGIFFIKFPFSLRSLIKGWV